MGGIKAAMRAKEYGRPWIVASYTRSAFVNWQRHRNRSRDGHYLKKTASTPRFQTSSKATQRIVQLFIRNKVVKILGENPGIGTGIGID